MKTKRLYQLLMLVSMLILASLACNIAQSSPTEPQVLPAATALPQAAPDVEAAQPTQMPPAADDNPAPDSLGEIPAGSQAAVADCTAFNINAFNEIIGGTFTFITQDQLNNCNFESDNGFRLLIGGGNPISSVEVKTQFDSTFGAVPGSSWQAIDDFYLGMAASSVSVTAQGISASGHTLVIVAAAQSGSSETMQALAIESAKQLNAQY